MLMSHCYRNHRTIQLTRLFWKFLKRYLYVNLSLYGYYIIAAWILHTWSRILKSLSTNYKHVLQSRYLVTYDITMIIVLPCIKISQYALQTTYHLKLKCTYIAERHLRCNNPDSKVHGTNMGPTWVLPAPGGPHVSPMNFAIRETLIGLYYHAISVASQYSRIRFKRFVAESYAKFCFTYLWGQAS